MSSVIVTTYNEENDVSLTWGVDYDYTPAEEGAWGVDPQTGEMTWDTPQLIGGHVATKEGSIVFTPKEGKYEVPPRLYPSDGEIEAAIMKAHE